MSHNSNKKDWINEFRIPKIKNLVAKTIGLDMPSVQPMTQLEAAKGRPIKPYPKKYDTFASDSDLKNYILDVLYHNEDLKVEWLEISTSHILPINIRDDVYYSGVSIVSITCYEPSESPFDDIKHGKTICELKPGDPLVAEAYMIVESLKRGNN